MYVYQIFFLFKKKSEMVYHGCSKRNIDGTNRLIKKGDVCSKPTNI